MMCLDYERIGMKERYASRHYVRHFFSSSLRLLCDRRGLYRGLSLNYVKTIPNVAIYMSLYDFLKMRLTNE